MDLAPYVEQIQQQLADAAEAGGDDARIIAERLVGPLGAAMRLTLQDVLAAAAEEITTDLAPGSVELRVRGRELELLVTPPAEPQASEPAAATARATAPPGGGDGDDASMSRINLRMPDHLKVRIEQAAGGEGLSVNAWLLRAAAANLEHRSAAQGSQRQWAPTGAQRYTGWVR